MIDIPKQITAGQTINWIVTGQPDYPASAGWVVTFYLNPPVGGTPVSIAGTASGDDHLIRAVGSTTQAWAPGTWNWQIWAEKAGADTYPGGAGQIEIVASLRNAAAGVDLRSDAQIGLDNIRAMMLSLIGSAQASGGVKRYRIGGRELERYDLADLRALETQYITRVKAERVAEALKANRPDPRKTQVRMGRA